MGLQEQEYIWFKDNLEMLSSLYGGKHVVIKGKKVIGSYPTFADACEETLKEYELGTFIIQECSKDGKPVIKFSLSSFVSANEQSTSWGISFGIQGNSGTTKN